MALNLPVLTGVIALQFATMMVLNEIRQLLTYKDNPKKNCSDVNELIDLHVSAIRENIIKQQKLIEQLSDLRGTCDGLCTIDQCGVLKNLA